MVILNGKYMNGSQFSELPLESLSAILEYMFALQQEEKSKKMYHLMFPVEKFAHVTCMLDDN